VETIRDVERLFQTGNLIVGDGEDLRDGNIGDTRLAQHRELHSL
jgi:hypothetical protein